MLLLHLSVQKLAVPTEAILLLLVVAKAKAAAAAAAEKGDTIDKASFGGDKEFNL